MICNFHFEQIRLECHPAPGQQGLITQKQGQGTYVNPMEAVEENPLARAIIFRDPDRAYTSMNTHIALCAIILSAGKCNRESP